MVGRYWDVKPNVEPHGASFSWRTPDIRYSGIMDHQLRWQITDSRQAPVVLIDKIQYALDKFGLFGLSDTYSTPTADKDLWEILDAGFICHLNTSEIVVTANREKVEFTEESRAKIMSILRDCAQYITEQANAEIADAPNIAAAVVKYKEIVGKFPIKHLKWNGIDLHQFMHKDPNMVSFATVSRFERHETQPGRVVRLRKGKHDYYSNYSKIPIDNSVAIVEDDLDMSTSSTPRIAYLLSLDADDDPTTSQWKYSEVYVVKFAVSEITKDDGTTVRESRKAAAEEAFKWSKFNTLKLSEIPKLKRVPVERNESVPVSIRPIKLFDSRVGNQHWPAAPADLASLANGSGYYVVLDGGVAQFCGSEVYVDKLRSIRHNLEKMTGIEDVNLFGVLKRYVSKLGPKWILAENYLRECLVKLEAETVVLSNEHIYETAKHKMRGVYRLLSKHLEKLSSDSALRTYFEFSAKHEKTEENVSRINYLNNILGLPNSLKASSNSELIVELKEKAFKLYPLLSIIHDYPSEDSSEAIDWCNDLLMYVNEKDRQAELAAAVKAAADAANFATVSA